jgi:hypothetical protein
MMYIRGKLKMCELFQSERSFKTFQLRRVYSTYSTYIMHCKKELAIFPSPAGMSLIKLFLGGNNLVFSRPERVWSVTSRLGTVKWLTLFYSVYLFHIFPNFISCANKNHETQKAYTWHNHSFTKSS